MPAVEAGILVLASLLHLENVKFKVYTTSSHDGETHLFLTVIYSSTWTI